MARVCHGGRSGVRARKTMTRHFDLNTTMTRYIKSTPENTRHAMQAIEQRALSLMATRLEQQVRS